MKTVIITGTSSGLGKALFDYITSKSVRLICIARRFLPYQEAIAKDKGVLIQLIKQDLAYADEQFLASLLSTSQSTDAEEVFFINNAGMIDPIGDIGILDDKTLIKSLNVNFLVPVLLVNNIVKLNKLCGIPVSFINISSGAANHAIIGWGAYCATKAGSKMFFNVLQEQYKDSGIVNVYNIDPGVLDTRMQSKIRNANKESFPQLEYFKDLANAEKLKHPSDVAKWITEEYIGL